MIGAYDPSIGQNIKSDVEQKNVDMAFLAHFQVAADNATVTNDTYIVSYVNMTDAEQEIEEEFAVPSVPRNLVVTGNVSGITGDIVIDGTNYNDEDISETIALNGTAAVLGAKAFKTVSKITLPAQIHTPTAQVETVAVTAGSDKSATLVVRVTAAGMTNSPKDVNVAVTSGDDTTAEVAAKVRAALAADANIGHATTGFFTVSGSNADIILTAKTPAANDSSLAIALQSADTSTVTFGASGNTTAGVSYDKVKVGTGEKLGLPYKLAHNTVLKAYLGNTLEGTAPTVTVDTDEIEKNTVDLNSSLNSSVVDVYLMV
jgi:hypothetical protein